MLLVVGLGNPGDKYTQTRHNIGFKVVDQFVSEVGLQKVGTKFKSKLFEGSVDGQKVLAIKPQTYMNLSGEAVQLIKGFYKLEDTQIMVVFDDFELNLGDIRIRAKGSAGTHNGMKDIVQRLGLTIPRLRMGIGPRDPHIPVTNFVLANFLAVEKEPVSTVIDTASLALKSWVKDGLDRSMNKYNS